MNGTDEEGADEAIRYVVAAGLHILVLLIAVVILRPTDDSWAALAKAFFVLVGVPLSCALVVAARAVSARRPRARLYAAAAVVAYVVLFLLSSGGVLLVLGVVTVGVVLLGLVGLEDHVAPAAPAPSLR